MADRVLRARLEAETSGFAARMAAAEAQFVRLDRAPRAAARGMGMLQSGMQALAFQATGVAGPLGRVAAGMGTLALGSPVILGIMAGIGAVTLLVKHLGDQADESKKRIDGFLASLRAEELKAFLPGQALGTREAEKAALLAERAGLRPGPAGVAPSMLSAEEARARERILQIDERLLTINHDIGLLRGKIAADALKTAEAAEREADALAKAVDRMIEFGATAARARQAAAAALVPTPSVVGGGVLPGTSGARLARLLGGEDQTATLQARALEGGLGSVLEKLTGTFKAGKISVEVYADAIAAAGQAHKDSTAIAVQAVFAISAVAQSLIRGGGGVGGFLSGLGGLVGGIVGAVNPLAGALIGAGSGIAGAVFDRGRREPVPVIDRGTHDAVGALQRKIEALEARRPKQITNVFFGSGFDSAAARRAAMENWERERALGGGLP